MVKRIAAILFIFVCTSAAWAILGGSILARTFSADDSLRDRVASTWGMPHSQLPPQAHFGEEVERVVERVEDGKTVRRTVKEIRSVTLPLEASRIEVALDLEHRQKGLLWYSTYKVGFQGRFTFQNPGAEPRNVEFELPLPAAQAVYDDLRFAVDGQPVAVQHAEGKVRAERQIPGHASAVLEVSYRSQGLDSWSYRFGEAVAEARDFRLHAVTNFKDVDFRENSLSPTEKKETDHGWELIWAYKNLVSGFKIGIEMPEKLQPGPLAGRISFFAPVSLFFFFFLLFLITTIRSIPLHPMNYLFLAAAFFAFHLLLAYLADHISIHTAFALASATSVFLVVSYLRLVVGMRFAAIEAGLTQFVYLVLFSYAFFFKGFTGLTITIGSILTLFVVMQVTGRVNWESIFANAATKRS
jgi:inner membrane protein involved in colicin E2 resistance